MQTGLVSDLEAMAGRSPAEVRAMIRRREWTGPTVGVAEGYTQANLAFVPQDYAFEFLLFCQRNPKPCPVLEVTDVGSPHPSQLAPGADLRTDVPKYRVFEAGRLVAEPADVLDYWRPDLVVFLIGCALTFRGALQRAGVPQPPSSMFQTNIACIPAGRFAGPMIVSAKAIPHDKVVRLVQVTSRFPNTHGAPVHIGDPAAIGIDDLERPYFGPPLRVGPGETPVFWACGITMQAAALASQIPFMMTNAGGNMFITDRRDEETAAL